MAGHWYKLDGTPQYTVLMKDGRERDTTLRDAKKFGLLPSVTTIIGQIDKPALTSWKLREFLNAVQEVNQLKHDPKSYEELVWLHYKERTEIYSKEGTELHDNLEKYYKTGVIVEGQRMIIDAVSLEIKKLGYERAEAESSFGCELGYGGKIDLILHPEDPELKKMVIIDFKTKRGDLEKLKKSGYDDYVMQLAAYRTAVDPEADCYNLMISLDHPGVVWMKQYSEDELELGTQKFLHLLEYWKLNTGYQSGFQYED